MVGLVLLQQKERMEKIYEFLSLLIIKNIHLYPLTNTGGDTTIALSKGCGAYSAKSKNSRQKSND